MFIATFIAIFAIKDYNFRSIKWRKKNQVRECNNSIINLADLIGLSSLPIYILGKFSWIDEVGNCKSCKSNELQKLRRSVFRVLLRNDPENSPA